MTSWGIVATVKAPVEDVLGFVAWHLDLGAHRIWICLDDPDDPVFDLLKGHPRVRPLRCDAAYWSRLIGRRPVKHQVRQVANATRIYNRKGEVDWLAHIDVDEFMLPDGDIAAMLTALPDHSSAARMRPMEALTQDGTGPARPFKICPTDPAERHRATERAYPTWGRYLNGGFLSHVTGKLFVRRGLTGAEFRIHNVFSDQGQNPFQRELPALPLAHLHATGWDDWLARYRFRLDHGSYRAELKPARPGEPGTMNLHDLLQMIEEAEGIAGLRRFHDEVCADSPDLRARLRAEGMLREAALDIGAARARHFPQVALSASKRPKTKAD